MKIRVTPEIFQAAYSDGVKILRGELTAAESRRQLVAKYEIADRTASGYVGCVVAMGRGTVYKTIVSAEGMKFMLDGFKREGMVPLMTALKSAMAHITYLENRTGHREPGLRLVHDEFLQHIALASSLKDSPQKFSDQVQLALSDSAENRAARLRQAQPLPVQQIVLTRIFRRNPDVVAEVLLRAGGVCEGCRKVAPFKRNDGSPYLEVHHRVPLAQGGYDTVENATALCPNCHRERHYGTNVELKL